MGSLLSYELKKILKRPFTIVVCVGALAVMVFFTLFAASQMFTYAWGPDVYGSYEAIPQDKLDSAQGDYGLAGQQDGALMYTGLDAIRMEQEYYKSFEGSWDNERLRQIASDYQAYNSNPDIYTEEIDTWALQMREWTLGEEMSPEEIKAYNEANPIYVMKPEYQYGEYQKWFAVSDLLDEYVINPDDSINSFEEAFPLVEQPAVFEYHAGPQFTAQMQNVFVGIMVILMLIAGAAPIFSDEVACRTEPMLLAARYGRDKLVRAKILSGVLFALGSLLVLTVVNVLLNGAIYGFSGYNMPIQLDTFTYSMPFALTYLEYLFVILGFQVLGLCAMAALVMLLSTLMRSAIPVVFASGLFAVVITLLSTMGGGWTRYLSQTLPPGAASPDALLTEALVDGWGKLAVPQWILAIIVCAAIFVVSILVITRKYKALSKV
ncbi:hypothetical protein LJC56_06075 [Christensenellaceae bacterium OttesenSCG-928-K19]|nr:hypothetical protein [Christensenellaceae bacterium OttesenSCG-928-K19]